MKEVTYIKEVKKGKLRKGEDDDVLLLKNRLSAMSIRDTESRIHQEELPRRQYQGQSAMSIPRANPSREQSRHRGSRRKQNSITDQYNEMERQYRRINPVVRPLQTPEEIKTAELRRSIADRLRTVDENILAEISELLTHDQSSFNVSKMIGARQYRSSSDGKTYLNGLLHSFDDEPAEVKSSTLQTIKSWYKNGKLHRDNGPAYVVKSNFTGNVTTEEIWKNGKMISSKVYPIPGYDDDDDYYQSDGGDY